MRDLAPKGVTLEPVHVKSTNNPTQLAVINPGRWKGQTNEDTKGKSTKKSKKPKTPKNED